VTKNDLIDNAIIDLANWPSNEPEENHLYQLSSGRFVAGIAGGITPAPFCTREEFEARKAERQNKPDWKDLPDWAQWLAQNESGVWHWFQNKPLNGFTGFNSGGSCGYANTGKVIGDWRNTLERRPETTEISWPEESRIDVVGTNGNDGLHYHAKAPELTFGAGVFSLVDDSPKTASDYLAACTKVQDERGKQYDASSTGERSFDAAAEAFNCVTGKDLRGSDVCLILEMVKLIRQYSDPTRLHADSVLDKVSYSALWAEQLTKELS
jgi:hypothetical protein